MTVDVEDYFHVSALSKAISREDWPNMEYRAEKSTRELLELFAEYNVQATFFVLGWIARRSPELIKAIHAAGHEIACHGMSHELVYSQTPKVFRSETRDAKAMLEDITGVATIGYRAASWSITRRSLWALDIVSELGFKYDSSIFPIRHDLYGIPDAPKHPSVMITPAGRRIIEFPPSTARIMGLCVPVAGGGYFRLLPYALTQRGLRQINSTEKQAFIFYVHPWELDPSQPRIDAGWLARFRHYTNLSRTQERLRRLLGEFRFTTARDVLADAGLLGAKSF